MKKIIIILLIVNSFINCDGRERTKQIRKDSISKFKIETQKIDLEIYYPEHYVEIETDTIINPKTHVNIKNYTLMDISVLANETLSKDNTKITKYHRVFQSEITIFQKSKPVLKTILNAENFNYNTNDSFWNNATLEHAWVNKTRSTSELVSIEFSFINPNNINHYKYYRMEVDHKGNQTIYLLEELT